MKRTVKGPFNFHIFLYVHIIYKKQERYIGENVEKNYNFFQPNLCQEGM